MKPPLNVDMTGKVAVVTGATSGIGKEIARGLARMGARVVIGARDPDRGDRARREIVSEVGRDDVLVISLDVANDASIRAFAATVERRFDTLDVLVNNAGAWFTDRRRGTDGQELTFATNVVGPHLLTESLVDRLRAAPAARVVNVVSSLAGDYDVTDLQFVRREYNGTKAYAQSKQALRMLTWGLATRLTGTGVTANAVAPGFVRTDFNRHARGFTAAMIGLSARLIAVSPAVGADTPLWAAAAPELDGVTGRYFVGRREKDGKFRDPGAIAELERACREIEQNSSRQPAQHRQEQG